MNSDPDPDSFMTNWKNYGSKKIQIFFVQIFYILFFRFFYEGHSSSRKSFQSYTDNVHTRQRGGLDLHYITDRIIQKCGTKQRFAKKPTLLFYHTKNNKFSRYLANFYWRLFAKERDRLSMLLPGT